MKENKKQREAGPEDKEKISRVGRRHQKEAKRKRKVKLPPLFHHR